LGRKSKGKGLLCPFETLWKMMERFKMGKCQMLCPKQQKKEIENLKFFWAATGRVIMGG